MSKKKDDKKKNKKKKEENEEEDKQKKVETKFSVIMIGDTTAGKTSLLERYIKNTFKDQNIATIGLEVQIKTLVINDLNYKFNFLDTTGQEKYASLGVQYFRNCDGAILVYDVCKRSSFEHIEKWLSNLLENNSEDVPYVIFENKIDKPEEEWEVKPEEAEALKEKLKTQYFSVSAKTGENVENAFNNIVKLVIDQSKEYAKKAGFKISSKNKKKKKCC